MRPSQAHARPPSHVRTERSAPLGKRDARLPPGLPCLPERRLGQSFGSQRGASSSRRPSRAGRAAVEHVGRLDDDVWRPGGERSSEDHEKASQATAARIATTATTPTIRPTRGRRTGWPASAVRRGRARRRKRGTSAYCRPGRDPGDPAATGGCVPWARTLANPGRPPNPRAMWAGSPGPAGRGARASRGGSVPCGIACSPGASGVFAKGPPGFAPAPPDLCRLFSAIAPVSFACGNHPVLSLP